MSDYPDFKMIRAELEGAGFRFTRRWGQNFLTERKLLEALVRAGSVEPGDLVLEIGTGPGCMTFPLLRAGARVIGVEIDRKLHEIGTGLLRRRVPSEAQDRMTWIRGDFLAGKGCIAPEVVQAVETQLHAQGGGALKVISNLPYCIATPAILNLLESGWPWTVMVLTIQKEVGERLTALPGTKAYGAVRLLVEAHAGSRILRRLPAAAFWPRPKVDSCVLELVPAPERFADSSVTYAGFKEFTRRIFAFRRKTWYKSLKTASKKEEWPHLEESLESTHVDSGLRAEALNWAQILDLAERGCSGIRESD